MVEYKFRFISLIWFYVKSLILLGVPDYLLQTDYYVRPISHFHPLYKTDTKYLLLEIVLEYLRTENTSCQTSSYEKFCRLQISPGW